MTRKRADYYLSDGVTELSVARREARRERAKDAASFRRLRAIACLGGKCETCGEGDSSVLQVQATTEKSLAWNQVVFYRKVIEWKLASGPMGEKCQFAKLTCFRCKYNAIRQEALKRRVEKKEVEIKEANSLGTGCFYWIGEVRVEQMKRKIEKRLVEGNIINVYHGQLEDLLEEQCLL